MLGHDLKLPLQHDFRIAVANHAVRAADADQRNERTHHDCRRGVVTETALQNEQEHDRDCQSRDFEDCEARVFL